MLNQARAGLKQRACASCAAPRPSRNLARSNALLDQALANYLDLATTPEKCDEFLNRLMVQVEELEARFADFEEFVVQLAEKRTAFASAFEARKLELVEARNRKANGAADRRRAHPQGHQTSRGQHGAASTRSTATSPPI